MATQSAGERLGKVGRAGSGLQPSAGCLGDPPELWEEDGPLKHPADRKWAGCAHEGSAAKPPGFGPVPPAEPGSEHAAVSGSCDHQWDY